MALVVLLVDPVATNCIVWNQNLLMGISIFCTVLTIRHVGFAVRAAFDFAKVKTATAQELERNNQNNII